MSLAQLTNTCAACGAEESLDALLMRMIDDDQVRRLIADVIGASLPLGGLVVRYLRLHKPPKQRLRMSRVAALLGELVPDIQRRTIERKGRQWQAPVEAWKAALESVFDAADKGSLTLPLEGNGYLYETLMRLADQAERQAENAREHERRQRREAGARDPGAVSVAQLAQQVALADGGATGGTPPPAAPPKPPPGPSRAALAIQAEIAAKRGQRDATTTTHDDTKGTNDEQG